MAEQLNVSIIVGGEAVGIRFHPTFMEKVITEGQSDQEVAVGARDIMKLAMSNILMFTKSQNPAEALAYTTANSTEIN